ncbi:hypothetical protein ASE01_01390 [Nocardioides sp. Root190]|uniref:hypothetical protein n=1 Tax=Nocardioides sp. Root190 TaxID=1736488 RepID=UPI000701E76A|nr:hypothetical protein [Nocardioides sp. Root190]KRB80180.1 hypothetical protein ASE01_01390 [Nocardioides sp. Root190]
MTAPDTGAAHGRLGNPTLRWSVLGLLLGLVVACLAWSAWTVLDQGAGANPVKKIDSLIDPGSDPVADREKVLAAGRTFVQRFNTYGPDQLGQDGKMAEYAAVGDLMTAKFAKIFEGNVGYAEQTVTETGIDRVGTVYAVGVASIDNDSAELLVAGIVGFSYPDPEDATKRIDFEPLRFRYQVSMVKLGGAWQVDDLDDLDDDLPSFAEASTPGGANPAPQPSGTPSGTPSGSPSGTPSPSDSGTGE